MFSRLSAGLLGLAILVLPGRASLSQNDVSPQVLTAPEFYESLIPRLPSQPLLLYQNLLYEGDNRVMREQGKQPIRQTGFSIAERWRRNVALTRSTFLLRDALFSQQDHPYQFSPFALMLPANWITAAASQSGEILPPMALEIGNDSAWQMITTPGQLFGSFPPSEVLFTLATRSLRSAPDSGFICNARKTIDTLAAYARRLISRKKDGLGPMIQEGAEIIARSDTQYFGASLRKLHVIPIMVENPTPHEIQEGKGLAVGGRTDISDETMTAVRQTVYRRRLKDGDIALERYDLSKRADRERALRVLRELIPEGSPGPCVWLWVTGRLRSDREIAGEDASRYIDRFRAEVRAAHIEESRLRYVSKPSVRIATGRKMKQSLDEAAVRFRRLGLPLSVNLTTENLRDVVGTK